MRKNFTQLFMSCALGCFLFATSAQAQGVYQLPNPGFENWDRGIKLDNSTANVDEPVGWNSFKTGTGTWVALTKHSVTKGETNGNKYAIIKSSSVVGIIANGNMTTGIVVAGDTKATSEKNYNYSVTPDDKEGSKIGASNFRQEFTGHPDALSVKLKYIADGGSNAGKTDAKYKAQVAARIHVNERFQEPYESDATKLVAAATISPSGSEAIDWTTFTQPFDYNSSAKGDPAYVLITVSTNQSPGVGSGSDEVWVDDMYFVYYSTLSSLTVNGVAVEGFNKDITTYNMTGTAPQLSEIAATATSQWATVDPVTQTEENGNTVFNITVKGNDFADSGNKTTYKLVYAANSSENDIESIVNTYNGYINIDLAGDEMKVPEQILIEKGSTVDNTIHLTLANFEFSGMPLGAISIDNIATTYADGTYSFQSETVEVALAGGAILADVTISGTIAENGYTEADIDVIWKIDEENNIPIPVAFKGYPISEGLRLNNITLNGVTVENFNADLFNYKVALEEESTPLVGYTKANASNKVNVELDGNWIYLNVTDGEKSNSYKIANVAFYPIAKVRLNDVVDGNLALRNGAEIQGSFSVAGTITYNKTIENTANWQTIGLPYAPTVYTVAPDGTRTLADANWATFVTDGETYEAKALQAATDACIMKLKSMSRTNDVASLDFVSTPGAVQTRATQELSNGYTVFANNTLETVTLASILGAEATGNNLTFYLLDGSVFTQVSSATLLPPATMFIVYKGNNPAESILIPDTITGIGENSADYAKIYASVDAIHVENYSGLVTIYSLNGTKVLSKQVSGEGHFDFSNGTYVVQAGSTARVVIVK